MAETQTFTYDPTQDTLVDESNEARDAENLEVGEKMIAEQENLLAGKYKDAQELEKAYIELQQKMGEGDTKEAQPKTTDEESPEQRFFTDSEGNQLQGYQEDGTVNYETAETLYGKELGGLFKNSEIDPFAISKHFHENKGEVTDEMFESLTNAGLSKSTVEAYFKGRAAEMGYNQPQAEATTLSETEVAEVHGIAGGKDGYEQLMSWASDNMSDPDSKNFDEVIETGNKAAITFAVKALMGQYEDAVGRDSNLVQGKASDNSGDVYRSMAEVVRAMNHPDYDRDPAVRADVQRKLERSNLNV